MRPTGDDCEFGAHVDERGIRGREVEEQAGGAVDELGSVNGGVSSRSGRNCGVW